MSESLNPFENGPDRDDAKVRLYLPVSPSTPPETQDGSQDISATKSFNAHNTMLSGAAYAPVAAGPLVATTSRADRTLHFYDTLTWKRRGVISVAGAPYALAWSPAMPKGYSGSQLAFVDSVGVLSLCAPLYATGDTPATFKMPEMPKVATRVVDAHAGIVYALAWRMDGARLATGGGDRNVTIWDPRKSKMTGTEYVARLTLAAAVRALSFGPTEATASTLAIGLENGELRFWRTEAEATLNDTILNHSSAVRSVALDPSGKRLASGTRSGKLFVWLIEGAQCLMNVTVGGVVQALSFSKDGTYLAVGSGANASQPATMSVWSTATLERRADRVADGGWVEALQWHPEGRRETTQHAAAGNSSNTVVATKSVHRLLEGVNDGRVREWGITHIDVAMEIMLIVDMSGSMASYYDQARQFTRLMIDGLNPELNRIGLIAFGSRATVMAPLGSNHDVLMKAVEAMSDMGGTMYSTALQHCYESFQSADKGGPSRRRVMVFQTDGENEGSDDARTKELRTKLCQELHVKCIAAVANSNSSVIQGGTAVTGWPGEDPDSLDLTKLVVPFSDYNNLQKDADKVMRLGYAHDPSVLGLATGEAAGKATM